MAHAHQPASVTGGRRRGPRKGDLKEAAILETAWRLLATKPLSRITIEDFAGGAGISRSAFYFYFDSKEAVVRALATRVADEVRDATAAFFRGHEASLADLREGVTTYLGRWKERGAALRAMDALTETDEQLRAFWTQISEELLDEAAQVIEQRRRSGQLTPGPPAAKDLARVLFAMLWRVGQTVSLHPMSEAEEQSLIETVAIVAHRAVTG